MLNRIDNEAGALYNELFEAHFYKIYDEQYGGVVFYGIDFDKTFERFCDAHTMREAWLRVYRLFRLINRNAECYMI